MNDVLPGHLTPVPTIDPRVIKVDAIDGVVVAINVPPHPRVIARFRSSGNSHWYEFPIRAGVGRRYMPLMEVEARMQSNVRPVYLALAQIGSGAKIAIDAPMFRLDHYRWRITHVDEMAVRIAQTGVHGVMEVPIPLAYIDAVFPSIDEYADWVIATSYYVTWLSGTVARISREPAGGLRPPDYSYRGARPSP